MDPAAEEALRVCRHPTIADTVSAFGVLYADDRLRAGNNQALRHAWRRNLTALRSAVGDENLHSTEDFSARFGPLIVAKGVLGAVIHVLEQAFELERTVEYIGAHLVNFRALKGSFDAKGLVYGDQDPNQVNLALSRREDITSGDWAGHAQINLAVLKGVGLDHHQAKAPEGQRWHLVLGRPPLNFILNYLFQAHDRFAPYLRAVPSCRFSQNSAFFRVALNVLAHIDAREAQAELVARISHSDKAAVKGPLERELPRGQFALFSSGAAGVLARWIDDPDWLETHVKNNRARYDRLMARGLADEERNPFARAFPYPQGWSSARPSAALERSWRRARYALETLDPRFAPEGSRGKHPLGQRETEVSLELAAMAVEMPNPMSKARSLGLSPKEVCSSPPNINA